MDFETRKKLAKLAYSATLIVHYVSRFHPHEIVGRGSEAQPQEGEQIFTLTLWSD